MLKFQEEATTTTTPTSTSSSTSPNVPEFTQCGLVGVMHRRIPAFLKVLPLASTRLFSLVPQEAPCAAWVTRFPAQLLLNTPMYQPWPGPVLESQRQCYRRRDML